MNSLRYPPLRVAAICLAATVSATLFAQNTSSSSGSSGQSSSMSGSSDSNMNSSESKKDTAFIKHAAASGMKEVDISRVAQDRATDPQVKDFAAMMVSDHTTANTELMSIAGTKGVALATDKDKSDTKWSKKSAKSFDKDYMKQMVSDHEEVVKLFQKEAQNGQDPDVRAFAEKYLPKLQMHLQKAQDLNNSLKSA